MTDGDNEQLSQPINEELFVERSFEASSTSSEDEDSDENSDQALFRPSTPLSEIEREKEEKRNQKYKRNTETANFKPMTSTNERTPIPNKQVVQPIKSSCCLLI